MSVTGSTLARRALGRELRRLREAKGVKQAAAARAAETSPQSIGRIEEGLSTRTTGLQVNALCDFYGASDEDRRTLLGLVSEVRASRERGGGWWRAYADELATDFDHYLALEEAARRFTAWKLSVIPGMLQTAAYRRALAWAEAPDAPTEQIEMRVQIATHRQTRLSDDTFTVDVLLHEAAVRDQVGGPAVAAEQLHHLAEMSERPNVSVRVVPFDARRHLGSMVGSFILLEFPDLPLSKLTEPPIIYVEEYAGDLYLERPEEISRYRHALEEIGRVALDQDTSRDLILAVAKEFA
ncbi:helix-turn-helix domain-containing protein [Nocardia sp. BSTN01]|uniref:helix-turn-helix domain-containing protein n=1 Tax=Nocardia sp. BSTN01 TaxID=2783665 RepID=UPI00188FD650|nr:helix-turn-helix transcriptional regulator [Nocardia sp. BSTN01]MBF4999855.1 helix-turn-helix domain-containing protein [Nocardia sp. BSTN01]